MYNFDEIIDRTHTNALNTDGFRGYIFHAGPEKVFPYADDEFVRMWVADMEFAVAPEICDALKARIDRRIFGYTGVYDDEYYQSFNKWCVDHYDWTGDDGQVRTGNSVKSFLYGERANEAARDFGQPAQAPAQAKRTYGGTF
jgi:bifunctional pyridoxal-dependent enzyme with beta-cystathionase and maltose regulon repressor activities